MTDYSGADEVAAVLAEVAPEIAGAVHTDSYAILRNAGETTDLEGAPTGVEQTVEAGRCRLVVSQRMGGERVSAGQVLASSLYTAELPRSSIVTESDTIEIGGREFGISDVKRGGGLQLWTVVELDER